MFSIISIFNSSSSHIELAMTSNLVNELSTWRSFMTKYKIRAKFS
jgi:hypothetical protein